MGGGQNAFSQKSPPFNTSTYTNEGVLPSLLLGLPLKHFSKGRSFHQLSREIVRQ